MATPTYITGFEAWPQSLGFVAERAGLYVDADFSGVGTVNEAQTSTVRTGLRAYRFKVANATNPAYLGLTAPAVNTVVFRGYLRLASLPASGNFYVGTVWNSTFSIPFDLYVTSAGVLTAKIGSGTAQTHSSLSTNTWYRIDWRYITSGTTWTVDWQVDGSAKTQATLGGQSANALTKTVYVGNAQSGQPAEGFWDDITISTTSGDYPLGASGGIYGITTDAVAAEHQSITTSEWQETADFSSFTNFTGNNESVSAGRLDDVPLNETDGIRMNVAGAVAGNARWPLSSPSGNPSSAPTAARACIVVREASTGTNNATFRIRESGGTTADIFSGSPGWGTAWNYLALMMATSPAGSTWTQALIDGLSLEADSTDASPNIWLSGIVVEVEYGPTVTVSVPLATISVAAAIPSLLISSTVSVPLATVSVAAPTPTPTIALLPPVSAVSLAAYAPLPEITLAPPVATVAAAGLAPTPTVILAPDVATVTVAAYSPTVDIIQPVNVTISVPVATISVAAIAPCVNEPVVIGITPDVLGLTGITPDSLSLTGITPDSLSLTGITPDSLSLTGITPDELTLTPEETC